MKFDIEWRGDVDALISKIKFLLKWLWEGLYWGTELELEKGDRGGQWIDWAGQAGPWTLFLGQRNV